MAIMKQPAGMMRPPKMKIAPAPKPPKAVMPKPKAFKPIKAPKLGGKR